MRVEEILVKCGLDEKEARVYLALLELGMDKVQAVAKKAEIKRPTAYVILEQLYAKNFVVKTYKDKKIYYAAEKPDMLLRSLKAKEDLFTSILPDLLARMAGDKARPTIKIYEGSEGVKKVYDCIYESAAVCFLGSIKNQASELAGLTEKFVKIIKSKNIFVRDLLSDNPKDIDFALLAKSQNYEGRVVPAELNLQIDCAIYENKVAILSIKENFFAVVIENREVADTFKSLFELAWRASTPLSQYIEKKKP